MAGYLQDLDELVLKCRNKNAREYIRESVASYRAGAYQSAIVSCWVAVCYDLIEKLRELSLAGDLQAEAKIKDLDKIYQNYDTSASLKFERDILTFARDKVELISALEYEDLDRILSDRHRCAHPSLNADGDQYTPPAELVRLHIHSAVSHLLQHEPAQGKFALDIVVKQLQSKYFPSKTEDVLNFFQDSPIKRARPSLVRNLISVLLKELFLEEEIDYRTVLKLTTSLSAVNTMHRSVYEARCVEILPGIVARVEDENLHRVAKNLGKFPCEWDSLGHTQKVRLKRYVQELPTENFGIMDDILQYSPLKATAISRVKRASLKDLEYASLFWVTEEIIDRAIELYHEAENYNAANKVAIEIKYFANDFSKQQVRTLLSKLADNSQILGSHELPSMLKAFRETASKWSLNFDDLLRDVGLEEYCEDVIDDDDEIPF